MIQAMVRGEDAQLVAMAQFLRANGLATLLRKKDWTGFVKRYNGMSYWRNHYDVKLAEQYQRFASGSLPNLEVRNGASGFALPRLRARKDRRDHRAAHTHGDYRIAAGAPQAKNSMVRPTGSCVRKRESGPKRYLLATR